MKTAISVPDDVFEQAERFAKRTRQSRSQLFSEAVREYLLRHAPDEVTDAMDRVVDLVGAMDDGFQTAASARVLQRNEW